MDWRKFFGGNNKDRNSDSLPEQKSTQIQDNLENPEMEKLLDSFMRTCWPSNYGDYTLGVDTNALKKLKGAYLEQAKAAILQSLEKSPDTNSINAANAIEMTEAIPAMLRWIQQIRSLEDKSKLYVAYSRLAYSLYNFTKEQVYLADLVESVRASGFVDPSGADVISGLWRVPLTIDAFSAVWEKLKKGKAIKEYSFWREACEDFLREKIEDPVGTAFLRTLPKTEQQEIQSIVATTKNQRIERNRRFERFVVGRERYNTGDLNKYGEYIKIGGSPVPGLTLRYILEGHTQKVNSTSWSPDGCYLASAGSDNTVRIWDVKQGTCISIIDGGDIDRSGLTSGYPSDYQISRVAWSPDGELIAFGSEQKNVSIWNFKKGTFVVPPKREGSAVRNLAWAPGQSSLLYSFSDNTILIKDIPAAKVQKILEKYSGRFESLAWSSDATFIAAGYWEDKKQGNVHENRRAEDGPHEILVWNVKNKRVLTKVGNHLRYIYDICWMPNQSIFAAASADNTISIWNVEEGRQIASLESHTSTVTGLSYSAGGVLLASTAEIDDMIRGTVRLWRTDTWQELIILKELGSSGHALSFHPTLPILATLCHGDPENVSMDSTASFIRIWDLDFETFLRNPPFMDEFNRMEANVRKQQDNNI